MIPDGGLGKLIAEGEVFFRFLELGKKLIIFRDSEAVVRLFCPLTSKPVSVVISSDKQV